jgi:hypothetical protein
LAIPPQQQNEAFFREVDEELRREHIETFWKRRGKAVAIAVAIGLVLLAAFLFWRHRQEIANEQTAEALASAVTDAGEGKTADVPARLAPIAKSGKPGYRAAAQFMTADLALSKGDDAAGKAALLAIENDTGLPDPFRHVALIRRTALEFDTLPPAQVVARLGSFARPGNPWFGSAGEMVAMAYLKMNRPQSAAPIFAGLAKDRMVPDSIRSRAVQMAGTLGIDAVDLPAAAEQ